MINPVGAGDSFVGGFLWKLLRGGDIIEALRFGTAVATASVMNEKPGKINIKDVKKIGSVPV